MSHRLFRRHVALPADHGSWVFLLSPLLIGLFAGGRWSVVTLYLVVASLAAFLARQPLTIIVKILSGRRGREDLASALFWTVVYGGIAALHVAGLVLRGFGYVLLLVLPGLPVFAWYLWLVSRKAERRQILVEILATGALALSAPAAYWVGAGWPDPTGWLLWVLTWAQSAASILQALMRLRQRQLKHEPSASERRRIARPAVAATTTNLLAAIALGLTRVTPAWLFVPFAVQWLETLWCASRPAIGVKPTAVGIRQLGVSTAFTLLFILAWSL
jgi:hypothetical protein